jgi:centromeric protein E
MAIAGKARVLLFRKKKEQIKVSVRMRPMLTPYESDSIWHIDKQSKFVFTNLSNSEFMNLESNSGCLFMKDGMRSRKPVDPSQNFQFKFDNVFDEDASTPEIYHIIARPITKAALNGYNGSVFMYGQTTSGKTYTMLGTPKSPGILP